MEQRYKAVTAKDNFGWPFHNNKFEDDRPHLNGQLIIVGHTLKYFYRTSITTKS
jgi:hypothetical protein